MASEKQGQIINNNSKELRCSVERSWDTIDVPLRPESSNNGDTVKSQNILKKYLAIYRFHSAYGVREGISRVWSIFRELDLYDLRRGINTRTIKVVALEKSTYMPYWPAFSSVVSEMIKFSHNYYISAIRYSDLDRKAIFVDFGAGLGKTPLMAAETGKFSVSGGIEIDSELVDVSKVNLQRMTCKISGTGTFFSLGNVEKARDISNLVTEIESFGINTFESTIFIFNKNSYGPDVLRNSLNLIEKYFDSIIYLYQNPIHHYVLADMGYIEFGNDSKLSTEHKNYKYRLFLKHNYKA